MDKDQTETREWYVIQSYAGCENSAKSNLERRIKSMNMEDKIFNILIPEVSHVEKKKNGTEKVVVEKIYPGYIFVEMICDDNTWFMVRNTPMVTGILGSSGGGAKPVPLTEDEINPILRQCNIEIKVNIDFAVGDDVQILTGSFAGQIGPVEKIDIDNKIVTVLVEVFGRQTPQELHFDEVRALK